MLFFQAATRCQHFRELPCWEPGGGGAGLGEEDLQHWLKPTLLHQLPSSPAQAAMEPLYLPMGYVS